MSRFHKIFLASALVVVGFGVAKFLGQPILLNQALPTIGMQAQAVPPPASPADALASAPRTAGSVRLLPERSEAHVDVRTANADTFAAGAATAVPEPPALGALAPVRTPTDVSDVWQMSQSVDRVPIVASTSGPAVGPRAKLRNEAPRSVGIDPHSPVAIRRMPSVGAGEVDPCQVANDPSAAMTWPAPQLINTGYSDANESRSPAAVAASYSAPASIADGSGLSPPPWPMTDENRDPRTHIIIDGDTLEKLAGRYLHDAHRSGEIYELNRAVLTSPELLPIGAELKIPERVASASWDRAGWQPNSASTRPNREAGRDNSLPLRPASAPQEIIPRAQLVHPVMVQ